MTWVEPQTQATLHVVTATEYNQQIIGNIAHLMYSRPIAKAKYTGANYTNNGGTTWAAVDSTNLKLPIPSTFNSQRLAVYFGFEASIFWLDANATPPYYGLFDLKLDTGEYVSSGTSTPRSGGHRTIGRSTGANVGNDGVGGGWVDCFGIFEGISQGAHNVQLFWKCYHNQGLLTVFTGLASPATPFPDVHMMAWEL